MLISQTSNSAGTLYFLPDAQGSTRALTEEGGLLGQTFDYNAFGNLQGDYQNGLDTNYLYTGQQFDPFSELYSLRARYYDPSLGRFLGRDTWAYDYQDPVELNRYVYAHNDPANYYDPSGYDSLWTYASNIFRSAGFKQYIVQPAIDGFVAGTLGYVLGTVIYNMFAPEGSHVEFDLTWIVTGILTGFVGSALGIYNNAVSEFTGDDYFRNNHGRDRIVSKSRLGNDISYYVRSVATASQLATKMFAYALGGGIAAFIQTVLDELRGLYYSQLQQQGTIVLSTFVNSVATTLIDVVISRIPRHWKRQRRFISVLGTMGANTFATAIVNNLPES